MLCSGGSNRVQVDFDFGLLKCYEGRVDQTVGLNFGLLEYYLEGRGLTECM